MKKVLIVGGGPLQLPLIEKVKELGHQAICVDGNPNAVGFTIADRYKHINIVDQDACLEYAKDQGIDGVLTVATDYGVLTVAHIAEKMKLPGLSYHVAQMIKNKYLVSETLMRANVLKARQSYQISEIEQVEIIKGELEYPVIVKPIDGSGSRGITIVTASGELREATIEAINLSITKNALIETFIEGKEYGVEVFVDNSEIHVLAILDKVMTLPPDFAELGHATVVDDIGLRKRIIDKVTEAIRVLEINMGSVNMDILVTDKNIEIIDIGARAGGNLISSHIVPLSSGVDLYGNSIKVSLGEKADFTPNNNLNYIATRILNFRQGKVRKIHDIQEIYKLGYIKDIIFNIEEGSQVREYHNNLDSCGYIVVEGTSIEDAQRKALYIRDELEKKIEII